MPLENRLSFDRVAERYDETRGFPPSVMRKVLNCLYKELEPYSKILDCGVGTGRFALPLQEKQFKVVGIDISRKMLERAIQKGFGDVIVANGCKLPFKDKVFDASLSVHFLHLIKDWCDVLKEINRVTKEVLVSISERPVSVRIKDLYEDLLAEQGWSYGNPGLGERELARLIKPARSIHILRHREKVRAREILEPLERKEFSFQWNVPDEIHKKAMEELRRRYAGRKIVRSYDVEMLIWDVEKLLASLMSRRAFIKQEKGIGERPRG